MPPLLKLLVFGLLDLTVIGWIVASSITSGISPGRLSGFRRDQQPFGFWLSVGAFVAVGLGFLAVLVRGLAMQG